MHRANSIDRNVAFEAFVQYVGSFDSSNPRIALKIDHTMRVASLCDRIARDLSLSSHEVDLAWLIGLLHDIGRFEQVRQFNTYNDAVSVDHAEFGVNVLFDGFPEQNAVPAIRSFTSTSEHDEFIRLAVASHSAYRLPENLDGVDRILCEILRDADKIDILHVNGTSSIFDIYRVTEDEMARSDVSQECVDIFYEHRCLPRSVRQFPADILLGHICFAWELVYDESLRIAREQGDLKNMLERSWLNETTAQVFARMSEHMKSELDL